MKVCPMRDHIGSCRHDCGWWDDEKEKCAILVLAESTYKVSPERMASIQLAEKINLNNMQIQKKTLEYLDIANEALKEEMENNG